LDVPECMVCWDVPSDVIYQCCNRHLVCAECQEVLWQRGVSTCPMCRGRLPAKEQCIRNYDAESRVASSMTTCPHCELEISREELRGHNCPRMEGRRISACFGDRVEHYTGPQGEECNLRIEFLAPTRKIMHFESGKHVRTTNEDDPQCMICLQLPSDKMYQCPAGHLICAECLEAQWQRNVRACPTCCEKLPAKQQCISARFDDRVEHYAGLQGEERILRIEFLRQPGKILHFESGKHVRTTYEDGPQKGVVEHCEDGECVKRTYEDCRIGLVEHLEAGKLVKETFASGHSQHGEEVVHCEDGKYAKRTFAQGHLRHKEEEHLEDQKLVKRTFAQGHAQHGLEEHFADGKVVKVAFAHGHEYYGHEDYHQDGKLVKTTFAQGHAQHGEEAHFENQKLVKMTFAQGHAQHGEEAHFEDGKFVKETCAQGHS
jgi:hypothetical protein